MAWKTSRRGLIRALAGAALLGRAGASGGRLSRFEAVEPHMGSLFRIVLYAADEGEAKAAFRAAFDEVRRLDEALSDYREESELNRLCRAKPGVPTPISDILFEALNTSQAIANKTDGAFDATLGPAIRLWRRARKEGRLPSERERREALAKCGWRNVTLDAEARTATLAVEAMQLDLGGIAKGLAADRVIEAMGGLGVRPALAAASGDIRVGGAPPGREGWRIEAQGRVLTVADRAISTSGDAEQFLEIDGVRYSHIVDPRTGLGLTNRLTATVVAPSAARADAWATALSVMGPERGLPLLEGEPETTAFVTTAHGRLTE